MDTVAAILLVAIAGLGTGSFAWPMKLQRKFQFEHWFFVAMLVGLIILPWTITLVFCPHAIAAYRSVDSWQLIKANLFGLAWGLANVLGGICFVRIGMALTGGFLTALGVSAGVTLPMVMKGSGLFQNAPDISSRPGMIVLCGVAIMLVAVVFVSMAGFGRDQAMRKQEKTTGGFLGGLIMAIIAGITSSGIGLAFVYGQGPIVDAMQKQGAGPIAANVAVWAAALFGAALVNVLYPAYLMTVNKNWHVLTENWREVGLSVIIGVQFFAAVTMMGKGMILFGALGASVGFGIQQAMQIVGNQSVGFISGEWHGINGKPRNQMYLAICFVLAAAVVLAYANFLAKSAG